MCCRVLGEVAGPLDHLVFRLPKSLRIEDLDSDCYMLLRTKAPRCLLRSLWEVKLIRGAYRITLRESEASVIFATAYQSIAQVLFY